MARVNDNGEPSGTAGRPILGQINSPRTYGRSGGGGAIFRRNQTRDFPASSRPTARAASLALDEAGIKEMRRKRRIRVTFGYETADRVMRVVKSPDVDVISKRFDNLCSVEIEFPLDAAPEIEGNCSQWRVPFIEEIDCRYGLKRMKSQENFSN